MRHARKAEKAFMCKIGAVGPRGGGSPRGAPAKPPAASDEQQVPIVVTARRVFDTLLRDVDLAGTLAEHVGAKAVALAEQAAERAKARAAGPLSTPRGETHGGRGSSPQADVATKIANAKAKRSAAASGGGEPKSPPPPPPALAPVKEGL